MLDVDAEKALHGAHDRPVQHDGDVAGVVLADVLRAQAAGHAEVHLHGAALPDAPDAILQRVLDLRTVERALARRNGELQPALFQRGFQRSFGLVPRLLRTDARLRTGGDLVDDVG